MSQQVDNSKPPPEKLVNGNASSDITRGAFSTFNQIISLVGETKGANRVSLIAFLALILLYIVAELVALFVFPQQLLIISVSITIVVGFALVVMWFAYHQQDKDRHENIRSGTIGITVHEGKQLNEVIADAMVTLAVPGRPKDKTDSSGYVLLPFYPQERGTTKTLTVKAPGYEDCNQDVVLLDGEKYDIGLKRVQEKQRFFNEDKYRASVYISDAKLSDLEQQMSYHNRHIAPEANRWRHLDLVLANLQKKGQLVDIANAKEHDYVQGVCMMKHGIVDWGQSGPTASFFFSKERTPFLLMAGSVYHLTSRKSNIYTFSREQAGADGSSLPNILQAIKIAIEHNQKWSDGIVGNTYDYLFALGFVQDTLINSLRVEKVANDFPEEKLEYVALVHKRLCPPSDQELKKLFANNTGRGSYKREIKQMLQVSPDILICSPICVFYA